MDACNPPQKLRLVHPAATEQETVTVLFDVLGDGRLITSDGSAIHIEIASALASLLKWEPFLRCPKFHASVSRLGTQVALGDGERVFVFDRHKL